MGHPMVVVRRFTGSSNPTRVKLRWDDRFLYIGAELRSRQVRSSLGPDLFYGKKREKPSETRSKIWKNMKKQGLEFGWFVDIC